MVTHVRTSGVLQAFDHHLHVAAEPNTNSRHLKNLPWALVSLTCLTELPIEILEQILLCLPNQDVIKMEAVQRVIASPDVLELTFCRIV